MRTRTYPALRSIMCISFMSLCLLTHDVSAREGTSRPPCGRTMWFTILVRKNIAIPQNGPINIPLTVVPYVFWNTNNGCAQPQLTGSVSTELRSVAKLQVEIDVKFLSVMTGEIRDFGIQSFDLPVPSEPGLQTAQIMISVPDGELDRMDNFIGQFDGTATVMFGAGVGSGSLSASSSAQAYLVQGAPGFPDIPRVDIEYVGTSVNDQGMAVCRRGDQAYFHFLVSNNDMINEVRLDLTSQIGQIAGLPDGFDPTQAVANYNAGVYAISNPGGDFFNHQFLDLPATWPLLAEGDPHLNPASLTREIVLAAGEARFITIAARSFGMCANGSCNKLTLRGEGEFSDGTDALACATTALVVDDMTPKSRRCEFGDLIKTDVNAATCFSKSAFLTSSLQPIPHASTHANGNVNPASTATGWWLYGANTNTEPGMFDNVLDYIRFDENADPAVFMYSVQYSGASGFAQSNVTINPLPTASGSEVSIPIIRYVPNPVTNITVNPESGTLLIVASGNQTVYDGNFQEFLESPPADFDIDFNTCRKISKMSNLDAREVCASRYSLSILHRTSSDPEQSISSYDQAGVPLLAEMEVIGDLFEPKTQTFNGDASFSLVKPVVPIAPLRQVGLIRISSAQAFNSLAIPYVASIFDKQDYVIRNESDMLEVVAIIRYRKGNVDVRFDAENSTIQLTTLSNHQNVYYVGDDVYVDGLERSPGAGVAATVIDATDCPAPCDIFHFDGKNNRIENLHFINFPANVLTLSGNRNRVSECIFNDNSGNAITIDSGVANTIVGGSYVNNGGLAIDLGNDGVSLNDVMDVDTGANQLQNFPEILSAKVDVSGGTYVEGLLHSTPNGQFTLQFFSNATCDGSEHGEGGSYLGETDVLTDGNGDASFATSVSGVSIMGEFITATARDTSGNTSEFSECKEVLGTTSLSTYAVATDFIVYPNPAHDRLFIEFDTDFMRHVEIDLLDALGRVCLKIFSGELTPGLHQFSSNTDVLECGVYFVSVLDKNGTRSLKVAVQ